MLNIVVRLSDKGADPNVATKTGVRPIHKACIYGQFQIVKKLVEGGTAKAEVYNKIIAKGKTFEPLDPKVNTFTEENSPILGNPKGDIVIVEMSDFQ